MYMVYLTLYSLITRSYYLVYIIPAISKCYFNSYKVRYSNHIAPFLYKILLMYCKKCCSGIVRNLVLSVFPVTTTKA